MKTVFITGAAGVLGKAVVNMFADNGYQVIGTYHRNKPEAAEGVSYFKVNLKDETETGRLMEKVFAQYTKVDVAVLTAGGFEMDSIDDASLEDIRRMISLNFETAYTVAQPLFRSMKQNNNGNIFLIGSQQGRKPASGTKSLAYTLSKNLLFALADVLREEAKNTALNIEVIVPSIIDSPKNRESMPQADTSQWQKPKDIAASILKACS